MMFYGDLSGVRFLGKRTPLFRRYCSPISMNLNPNRLYGILSVACGAGYGWLYYSAISPHTTSSFHSLEVCLFKTATGIPCPSCGSTRAVLALMAGNVHEALLLNPFGFVIALVMLLAPVWICYDLASKETTLFDFYCCLETWVRKPAIAFPLVLLVIINWIWNISKGL